ncbi:hypothetical protein GE09DRAFT_1080114 [Coniochaeta sp. 2T2.1]|nr:hypothetical protein GE09DRAFT_1080114 [Coniochaeta sp. 2T2.1]
MILLSPLNLLSLALLLSPSTASTLPLLQKRDNCTVSTGKCGCSRASFSDWQWQLTDFDFHSSIIFSTPSHQIDGGWVSFSLKHPAVKGVDFDCEASSTQLQDFFYGGVWYPCEAKASETGGEELGKTKASFMFDRSTGMVNVSQSWVCRDQDPRYPISFKALGGGHLKLSCNETKFQNLDWTPGQTYSSDIVQCALANATIPPSEQSAVA